MDAIEDKIARLEALNEVARGERRRAVQEADIDAKLQALEGKSEVDDALEQLKTKMRAKALEEGKK
jgi:phage shock protein A